MPDIALQIAPTNEEVTDYLNFYINLPGSPGYAVFLNGPWGCGKTFFINRFRNKNKEKYLYVSLYGVSSTSEIEEQLFQQLHPILASKLVKIASKFAKSALKASLKVDLDEKEEAKFDVSIPDIDIKKLAKDVENRILIFDDLERCTNLDHILGYINHYVEHQGQKVILIGHETEISDSTQYRRKSEKLIGRRFTINPELDSAFTTFVSEIPGKPIRDVLLANKDQIFRINERTGSNNLRTLKHSILEYGHLYSLFPERAQQHSEFQSACINSFFSFSAEIRAGRIKPQEIRGITKHYMSHYVDKSVKKDKNVEPDQKAKIYEKHFGSSLQDMVPTEEVLYYFFDYGFVPPAVVEDSVKGCHFFINDTTPAWMKLWHLHSMTDGEFELFLPEVKTDFSNYKFTNPGELKHVIGMFIDFAKNRVIDDSYETMVELSKKIVKEMVAKELIEQPPESEDNQPRFDDAYAGLGFASRDDENFLQILSEIRGSQKAIKEKRLVDSAPDLLSILKSDSREFWRLLTTPNSKERIYVDVPILAHLSVNDTIQALVAMDPSNAARLNFGYALKERYKYINIYPELAKELAWLKQLNARLSAILPSLKQPTRFQLENIRSKYLKDAVETVEKFTHECLKEKALHAGE